MTPETNNIPKLEISIAELNVLLKIVLTDVLEIKNRLSIMEEQFARKSEVQANAVGIRDLNEKITGLRIELAVTRTQLSTWGIIGGILITLLSAGISALQIHF